MALTPFGTLRQLHNAPPETLNQIVVGGGLAALAITLVIYILLVRDKRRGIGRYKTARARQAKSPQTLTPR